MRRASLSLSICLAVVPEETSEWKPLTAPQAMTMKRKGMMLGESGTERKAGATNGGLTMNRPR